MSEIPELDIYLEVVSTPVKPRYCVICKKEYTHGSLGAYNRPFWVINEFTYYIWRKLMWYLFKQRTDGTGHRECIENHPKWSFWQIIASPDLNAYHSLDAEIDLEKRL